MSGFLKVGFVEKYGFYRKWDFKRDFTSDSDS